MITTYMQQAYALARQIRLTGSMLPPSKPPSRKNWRKYDRPPLQLTPAGLQLIQYLDYVEAHPGVPGIEFDPEIGVMGLPVAAPTEQLDDDRQPRRDHRQEQLDGLYEELSEAMDDMMRPNLTDSAFEEYRLRVKEIRLAIYEIEGK